MINDHAQYEDIKKGNIKAFEMLYHQYFRSLVSYATLRLGDEQLAKDTVQQVFLTLWEKKHSLEIKGAMAAYLMSSVKNACFNTERHHKVKKAHEKSILHSEKSNYQESTIFSTDLQNKIHDSLTKLPDQCRRVFHLSRFEEKSYKEISDKLSISIKTVEVHMGKALRILREELKDYLMFLILFYCQ